MNEGLKFSYDGNMLTITAQVDAATAVRIMEGLNRALSGRAGVEQPSGQPSSPRGAIANAIRQLLTERGAVGATRAEISRVVASETGGSSATGSLSSLVNSGEVVQDRTGRETVFRLAVSAEEGEGEDDEP